MSDRFSITFSLTTEIYQEYILDKRFEIGRKIYNALLDKVYKRYNRMIETKKYRDLKSQVGLLYSSVIKEKQKELKLIYKELDVMYKEYKLSEYAFCEDIKSMYKHHKTNIDSLTAQTIATRVWKSIESLLFGNGESVHFKKYDMLMSVEGKWNKSGIKFKDNYLIWNELKIPVKIDYNNPYESQAMQNDICFCRIKRKFVRGKYKYYLQLVLKGMPPIKINKETGEIKRYIGKGNVGLDIGTQTIAISSNTDVKLLEIADKVQNIENEKRKLQRYMDRSKKASNPDNFNENGTIKKQGNKKVKWNKSNKYIKAQNKLKELHRKQVDVRKLQHEILSNYIISLGDKIYVERMNFKGLQKRSNKTTVNEKTGKINNKKRFGKSIANKAPAMLIDIIDRKFKYFNKEIIKINTWSVKASQYNHFDGEYNKKQLSTRWNNFNGIEIQRDLYSAFLIMNVNDDLNNVNKEQCETDFDNFKILHDVEIKRLSNIRLSRALMNVI